MQVRVLLVCTFCIYWLAHYFEAKAMLHVKDLTVQISWDDLMIKLLLIAW